jgi:hypothetical protein
MESGAATLYHQDQVLANYVPDSEPLQVELTVAAGETWLHLAPHSSVTVTQIALSYE